MKRLTIILASVLAMTSCLKDLGNYYYHDLVEPEISGIDQTITLSPDRMIDLEPKLGDNEFPDEAYSFEWMAVSKTGVKTVLGKERNLKMKIDLIPGTYSLFFTVKEKASEIFWQEEYTLIVNDITSEGWLVLCSEGAERRAVLDMYSKVTGTIHKDILKSTGLPDMHGPYKISYIEESKVDPNSPFYLTTEEGATRLGFNGFEWKEEYLLRYEIGNGKAESPVCICPVNKGKMFCGKETVYYSDCLTNIIGLFSEIAPHLVCAPVVGMNLVNDNSIVPVFILYDIENKQFMAYAPGLRSDELGNSEPLNEMNDLVELLDKIALAGDVTGNAFEEFPKGMDYVYMENTMYDPNDTGTGITYAILKNNDTYQLYGIQAGELFGENKFGGPTFALGKALYADISDCIDIAKAEHFAFSSLSSQMYYSVGNKIYRAELNKSKISSELQITLPAGEDVSLLKFNFYKSEDLAAHNYDLVVGSNHNDSGTLRIYEGFKSEGNFKGAKPTEIYDGFGHIVDITYRERL